MAETPSLELVGIAASDSPVPPRAQDMLEARRRLVPFDPAWLAVTDPTHSRYATLASLDLDPGVPDGVDPLRSLSAAAGMVRAATAGIVLRCDNTTEPLPGLGGDVLLTARSAVVTIARSCIDGGQVFGSFLWPLVGARARGGHVRVTVLAGPGDERTRLLGAVVLSAVGDLRGLTPRELEVLGLLIDGRSNQQIAAALVVSPRTVAAHLEHILVKLDAPTRTLAAVRAEREGLYVPLLPSHGCT